MDLESLNRQIIACRRCPRLVAWREQVARRKRKAYADWKYWGKPVPGFGDPKAEIMVVGLAPGAHGSNRTGRQFTGDASGGFLYPALFRAGFASQPDSTAQDDGLALTGLFVTASARCAPPGNKPTPAELDKCQPYLERELEIIRPKVIVCLGQVAFSRILKIFALHRVDFEFQHGAVHRLPAGHANGAAWLLCSYHPSQQNTATGRLTVPMFDAIWAKARELTEHA